MKQKNALRSAFQVAAILVVLFLLTGYLLITSVAAGTSIYFPLINRLNLVGEELNSRLLISEVMCTPSVTNRVSNESKFTIAAYKRSIWLVIKLEIAKQGEIRKG